MENLCNEIVILFPETPKALIFVPATNSILPLDGDAPFILITPTSIFPLPTIWVLFTVLSVILPPVGAVLLIFVTPTSISTLPDVLNSLLLTVNLSKQKNKIRLCAMKDNTKKDIQDDFRQFPNLNNNFSLLVGIDHGYICNMAYATSQFYRHFTILKKNGKTRDIYEPLPDLKYVQTWILENILEKCPVSPYAKAYVKGRTLKHNAKFHKAQKTVVTMDIKDFLRGNKLVVGEELK